MDKYRILVVEDEQIVAAGLRKRLLGLGYEVPETTSSGEEAVRLAGELRPDLVLMDIRLEGAMDGTEAAAIIRRRFRIPVIYLTAYSNPEVLERAKITAPYGYVLKPFEERELHVVVEMGLSRHRTEQALLERERWLSALLTSIGDGVVATDDGGRVTFLNPKAEQLTGWPDAEARGKDLGQVFQIVHEETRQAVESPLHRAMREGVSVPMANHTALISRDRTERPIDDCATPITDEGGATLGGVMVFRDVTDRKSAEAELRLRERAIQAVSQGILITDPNQPDNPIIYASPGFLRLTGFETHEVKGRNARFLHGRDTDRETVARIRAAVQAGRALAVELLNYKKDGTPFWNALSLSPVHDDNGKVTHFVGVQTDVTERRKLEAQYRQAQKMEAIGRLAGGVAHDFNNLLTVINGYSQVVTGMLHQHDKARELVEEIHKAGERAAALTQQLLAYSRKQFQQLQVLNLNDLLARAEKMLRRMIGEDVELVTVPAAGLYPVKADPGQLDQVVMNLAVNARDAMPTGGKLTVETQNVRIDDSYPVGLFKIPPGPYVLLAVTDTGSGMDEKTKEHIFEPFFTTKGDRGTGLGLATVYGIVKQSDGYIQVYSEPGHGTTFKIYLPSVADASPSGKSRQDVPPLPGGTETVLLVEDEDAVRSLMQYVLKECGYKVLAASGGAEALDVASRHEGPLDLLVTDVVMPRMSGRQVAEALRLTHPGLGVLYVSGYTDDAVFRHGILESETDFLQKPFALDALARKVREVLDRR